MKTMVLTKRAGSFWHLTTSPGIVIAKADGFIMSFSVSQKQSYKDTLRKQFAPNIDPDGYISSTALIFRVRNSKINLDEHHKNLNLTDCVSVCQEFAKVLVEVAATSRAAKFLRLLC